MPFKSLLRVHRFSFSMVTWTEKGWKPLVYGFRGNVSSSVERFFIWNLMLSPSALLCFDLLCQRKLAKNLESEKFNLKTTFTWIQLWLGFLYFEILVIEVHLIEVPVVEAFLVKVHVGSRCWGVNLYMMFSFWGYYSWGFYTSWSSCVWNSSSSWGSRIRGYSLPSKIASQSFSSLSHLLYLHHIPGLTFCLLKVIIGHFSKMLHYNSKMSSF